VDHVIFKFLIEKIIMKFIVSLLLIMLLSFASSLYFPWWMITIAAFIVSISIPQTPAKAFLCGFLAVFLLWGAQAFFIDYHNNHILANKIAHVLPLGGHFLHAILVTGFVGGLVAGMASLTASFLRVPPRKVVHQEGFQTKKIELKNENA
jgi:hypothetical protein